METFISSVVSYDSETGSYFVRNNLNSLDTEVGIPAPVLSPTPGTDGGGMKSAPLFPPDTQCLVLKDGNRYYIMGFIPPHGYTPHGDSKPVRPINPGDTFLTHNTPSKLGITADGSILLIASKWAQLAINPIISQLTGWFKNVRLNFYSMLVEYFADTNKKGSTARVSMTKWVNNAGLPITPPDGSSPLPQDHFTFRAGTLDDDHILELLISQDDQGIGPQHISKTFIGKQKDGTTFDHEETSGTTEAPSHFIFSRKDDGTIHLRSDSSATAFVDALISPSSDTPINIGVNGKTTIQISKSGDITLETPDGAGIFLGGKDKAQRLVTESFITQYYNNHIHSNGNQGAPTGPPTPTATISSADSKTGVTTFTTQAE